MPWTVADVDRFKKGLTTAQKRRWVRVANSVLAKCKSNGGSNCEASAIRQANGTVNSNTMEIDVEIRELVLHSIHLNNYQVREATLNGRKHIVVPVVMMKEGVHNGSAGAIFHRSEELAKFVETWNGIPITVPHPEKDGINVSANSPEILEEHVVGRVFHTHYDDGLKAEAWLDVERLRQISPNAYAYIMQGRQLDVSVGVYSDTDDTEGEWNGETYESTALNYRPDHLALLPGEHGACSWNDGCGIRANQKGGKVEDLFKVFKELNQKGFAVSLITNEQGYRELVESIRTKLDGMDTNDRVHYLQEVYDDYLVYAVSFRESGGTTLYKREYTVNDSGEVSMGDKPVEVRRKVEYVAMKMVRVKDSNNNNQNKGGNMANADGNLCCEAKVDALIANTQTRFTLEDKDWLMGLEEAQVDKLSPMEPVKPKEGPKVNKDQVIDEFKDGLKSIEDYTSLMPEAMRAQVESGVKLYKEHRESLVKGIVDFTGENFSREELEAMEDHTLEAIFKSVKPADYSGQGGPATNKGSEEEMLLPAGVGAVKKED